jgi:precorrin-2/cobalt-factor-2 C20-methyltransferase
VSFDIAECSVESQAPSLIAPEELGVGTLYAVSLGPGDPGLITRQAWEALQRRDAVWVYPARSTKTSSYALDIVLRAGLEPPTQHQPLLFPMTHDAEKLMRSWQRAAESVAGWLQAGQDVLFLVEGDASTYATFGHLARTLQTMEPALQVQVLPGVNAFTAACATVQSPLSEQDDTVAIVPAAYGVNAVDRLLKDFDTLVLLKVKPLIDDLINWLEERELIDDAVFVERCGAPDERCVRGREMLSLRGTKVNYLSLMLVRSHYRVRGERIKGCLKKSSAALGLAADADTVIDDAVTEIPSN